MVHLLSPTGKSIRADPAGDGHYGSKRGDRIHLGTDFICTPGQTVHSPAKATVLRISYPYKGDVNYSGIFLDAGWCYIKIFYFEPFVGKGVELYRGQPMGIAQDISLKYPGQGMVPHVHLELSRFSNNPELYTISGG